MPAPLLIFAIVRRGSLVRTRDALVRDPCRLLTGAVVERNWAKQSGSTGVPTDLLSIQIGVKNPGGNGGPGIAMSNEISSRAAHRFRLIRIG